MHGREARIERESRTRKWIEAYLLTEEGCELRAVITDISTQGCQIRTKVPLAVGNHVRVELPRVGSFWAQIRWSAVDCAGALFVPDSEVWELAIPKTA